VAPDYRKYLVGQSVAGAVINFFLNAAIGWLLYRQLPRVPLYGAQSMAGDVVVTSLLLPVLICLIATPLIRGEVARARLPAVSWLRPGSGRAVPLPSNLFLRALLLGLLSALLVSPIMVLALRWLGVHGLKFWSFVAFKASFAAALAAVITPIVASRALEDGVTASGARFIAGH
jgi:hypothetical protein